MKIRDKNSALKELIAGLDRRKAPIWKALAKGLNRPRRIGFTVNVYELEKFEGDLVVPGKVLGSGKLSKPIMIAALNFSGQARQAIEKAGGKALTIQELAEKNPSGKGVRIVG